MAKTKINMSITVNHVNIKVLYIFLLIFLLLACNSKNKAHEKTRKEIADPYIRSFWNKNIVYQLNENPLGGFDTIFFDKSGNISEIHSLGRLSEKLLFNDRHLLTQYRIGEDLGLHYLVSYDTSANLIIQRWTRIMNFNWNYSPEDVNQLRTYHSIFIFNDDNLLLKEVNLKDNIVTNFTYKGKLLIERNQFYPNDTIPTQTRRYYYKNKEIAKIEEYYYGDHSKVTPNLVHYFNTGTLDSTQEILPDGKVWHTEKYKYSYF